MSIPTALEVVVLAFCWSGAVGLVGLAVLRLRPMRSVRSALTAVALVGVLSLVAGVLGASRAMFLSSHDLAVVLQVSLVAGLVAVALAVAAGRTVVRDVALVRRRAATIGDVGPGPGPQGAGSQDRDDVPELGELREVEAELALTGRRLAEARDREQSLETARRELVAWVSHDLRTPLAGLRGMAEALQDGVATDPDRYLRQMVVEVERLSALVDDLFELSRIQAGALQVRRTRVDLVELAAGVLGDPAELTPGDVGPGAGPVAADVDPRAVVRAVRNLVENARRYGGGTVRVEVARRAGSAVVAVQDACGGIDDADLAKLFEPGWQGSVSRSTGAGGGLGLAIARGIARAHGGDVTVENHGAGCRFELSLP